MRSRHVRSAAYACSTLLLLGPQAYPVVGPDLLSPTTADGVVNHDAPGLEREAEALAARWAPVFVQHVATDHPERDRPLPLDFDGNWNATDNWAHLTPAAQRQKPVVYGSAILTTTHAYLTYTLFFPRDWEPILCVPYACHDNDLEATLLVVERGLETRDHDRLVLVETKTHRSYLASRGADVARAADGRPVVEVESQGHGLQSVRAGALPEGDLKFFVPERAASTVRAPAPVPAERYGLLSLHETLWQRRSPDAEHGRLWIEGESGWLAYSGARQGRCGRTLGASMAGREYPGGVRPPWALQAGGKRGDWFLDPAFSVLRRYRSWFAANRPADTSYVLNRYLDDLKGECSGARCPPKTNVESTLVPSPALASLVLLLVLASRWLRRPVA